MPAPHGIGDRIGRGADVTVAHRTRRFKAARLETVEVWGKAAFGNPISGSKWGRISSDMRSIGPLR